MVELPTLLLTANVSSVFKVCAELDDARDPVICDASRLVVAEPMALCALVATLARMQRLGRDVRVTGLSLQFKRQLEELDILARTLHVAESERTNGYQGNLHAYRVRAEREGDEVGNKIACAIATLIPSPRPAISALDPAQRYREIEFPLAYIFTELIDNALRHGRGRGYDTMYASVCDGWRSVMSCILTIASGTDTLKLLGTRYSAVHLRERVEEQLAHCDSVEVDFGGVFVTQSFVDELFGPLILRIGPALLQRLMFSGCGEDAQAILRLVFANRIKDFSSRNSLEPADLI